MHLCSTSTRTNMWKGTGRLEKKKPVHFPMYPTFSSSPLWLDSRLRCDKCIPLYLKEKKSLFLFFRGLHVQRAMLPNNLPVHSLHSIKSAPALTHTQRSHTARIPALSDRHLQVNWALPAVTSRVTIATLTPPSREPNLPVWLSKLHNRSLPFYPHSCAG